MNIAVLPFAVPGAFCIGCDHPHVMGAFACISCRPIFRRVSSGADAMPDYVAPTPAEMLAWLDEQDLPDELTLRRAIADNDQQGIDEAREGMRMLAAIKAMLRAAE